MFCDYDPGSGEEWRFFQGVQDGVIVPFVGVGWIEKDEVERGGVFGFKFSDGGWHVSDNEARGCGDLQKNEIFADKFGGLTMVFDKDYRDGAAADRLDADRAGSSEEIEETRALDARAENVEQRFAQHVTGGTNRELLE